MEYYDDQIFVVKNTKVFPARMYCRKEKTGARLKVPPFFTLRELDRCHNSGLIVDPAIKIRVGNRLLFRR